MIKYMALSLIAFLLLPIASVLAQREWITTVVSLLGEVPRPCAARITPQCLSCIVYTKLFPLLFFLAIFFLIFFYVIRLMRPPPPPEVPLQELLRGRQPQLLTVEMKVITILSVVISLILLNSLSIEAVLTQFKFWIYLILVVLAIMLARSVYTVAGPLGMVLFFLIIIVVFIGIWAYVGSLIEPAFQDWIRVCA